MTRWFCLLTLLLPALAVAQDNEAIHPYLNNKFTASIGIFRPDQRMELSLEASFDIPDPEPAPYLDFAETFSFSDSDQTFSAEIAWRFGEKWQLRGQYFRIDNGTRATLEEDVEWGDYVFNEGTSVGAGTDFQITRLFFGRRFLADDRREAGLGLGGHILDISAYIKGNATVNGVDVGFRQERASISQPLPNFGAWYMHAFSPKWAATVRIDWLDASYDKYDGRILNAAASLGYAVTNHFGIALAYNFFELKLDIDERDWDGGVRSRFDGLYLSLTGYW